MRFLHRVVVVVVFFFFLLLTHVWHYSLFMNGDFRLMNSAKCVNSNFLINFLLFSIFSKISGIQTDPKYYKNVLDVALLYFFIY